MSDRDIVRKFTAKVNFAPQGESTLTMVGDYLSKLRNDDYKYLVECSKKGVKPDRKKRREYLYSCGLSKRYADSIILANKEQWQLADRTTKDNIKCWERDIFKTKKKLKNASSLVEEKRLRFRISQIERKIIRRKNKNNSVCFGGRKLFHEIFSNPYDEKIQEDWFNKRLFLNFAGEGGRAYGNDIVKYNPDTKEIWLYIPQELANILSLDNKMLVGYAQFKHGGKDLARCISNNISVSHEFRWNTAKRYWVLDSTARFDKNEIVRHSHAMSDNRVAGIDFNNEFINVCIADKNLNPLYFKRFDFHGKKSIPELVVKVMDYLQYHHVGRIFCEQLSGMQRRQTSKISRSKGLNRVVSSMPTGDFAEKIKVLSENRGIKITLVTPRNTSKNTVMWPEEAFGSTRHDKASYLIARRGMGLSTKRRTKKVPLTVASGLLQANAVFAQGIQPHQLVPLSQPYDNPSLTRACSA